MSEQERVYGDPEDFAQISIEDLKKYAQGMQHEIDKARRTEDNAGNEVTALEEYLAEIKRRTGKDYDPQTDKDYNPES